MEKKKYNPQHKNMQNNQKYGAVAPTPHSPTQNDTLFDFPMLSSGGHCFPTTASFPADGNRLALSRPY